VPVTIKDAVVQVALNGTDIALRAPEAVVIPARGSASLRLEGPLPGLTAAPAVLPLDQFTLSRMSITVDVSGIELQWEGAELGGLG
jgi:hypothetical protein